MVLRDNFYSHLVAWMKIILPLAALGLLCVLFMISSNFDPTTTVPVVEIDLEQRAQDQRATNATFAGVTSGGDQLSVNSKVARPDKTDSRRLFASDVSASFRLTSGAVIDLVSDHADMHHGDLTVMLDGNVNIVTTTGYDMDTDSLFARFDHLFAETPGPVIGHGPPGDLEAGRMVLETHPETGDAHLFFTDGVKLIYKPTNSGE